MKNFQGCVQAGLKLEVFFCFVFIFIFIFYFFNHKQLQQQKNECEGELMIENFTNCTTPSSVIAVTPQREIEVRLGQEFASEIWSNPASVIRHPHLPFDLHPHTHPPKPKHTHKSRNRKEMSPSTARKELWLVFICKKLSKVIANPVHIWWWSTCANLSLFDKCIHKDQFDTKIKGVVSCGVA